MLVWIKEGQRSTMIALGLVKLRRPSGPPGQHVDLSYKTGLQHKRLHTETSISTGFDTTEGKILAKGRMSVNTNRAVMPQASTHFR